MAWPGFLRTGQSIPATLLVWVDEKSPIKKKNYTRIGGLKSCFSFAIFHAPASLLSGCFDSSSTQAPFQNCLAMYSRIINRAAHVVSQAKESVAFLLYTICLTRPYMLWPNSAILHDSAPLALMYGYHLFLNCCSLHNLVKTLLMIPDPGFAPLSTCPRFCGEWSGL